MNKAHFLEHLKFALFAKLQDATLAANSAKEDATHEQSAAETQYDSLSIESAYLAQGQSERVDEVKKAIKSFESIYSLSSTKRVSIGSLVCCEREDGENFWYFVGPAEGGLKLTIKQTPVWVITPSSPLGMVLITKPIEYDFEWQMNNVKSDFFISKIL